MLQIIEADLNNRDHQAAVVTMTRTYALDEMGNSGELPSDVMDRLIPGLQQTPTAIVFLALSGDRPVGIATCFRGFSTFLGRPLINIHDLAVHPDYQGQGIGRSLLQAVERRARELGCGRLTLEVQAYNRRAQAAYASFGFKHGSDDQFSGPLFLCKPLVD